jgi:hypothetical protein
MADKKAAGGLNFEYSEATLDQCNSCIYGKMHLTGFLQKHLHLHLSNTTRSIMPSYVGSPLRILSIRGGRF